MKLTMVKNADGSFYGFKKFIGGKLFHLGRDGVVAETTAKQLQDAFNILKNSGKKWDGTEDTILKAAIPSIELVKTPQVQSVEPKATIRQPKGLLLSDGVKKFMAHLSMKAESKQITPGNLMNHGYTLQTLCKVCPNRPLNEIKHDELMEMITIIVRRPKSQNKGHKPISTITVKNILRHTKELFIYLSDAGLWEEPRRFERMFKVKTHNLMTESELEASGHIPTFSINEFARLWELGSEQQRLYILLGLNCGYTAVDIATLTHAHIVKDEKGNIVAIKRKRQKTGVTGYHRLFPETARLLQKRITTTKANPNNLAILSRDGCKLVHFCKTSKGKDIRIDSVYQNFLLIQKKAKVKLSFKYWRKTGAQWAMNQAEQMGLPKLEIAQTYLCHAPTSIAEQHYVNLRNFESLSTVLDSVWTEVIQPAIAKAEQSKALTLKAAEIAWDESRA